MDEYIGIIKLFAGNFAPRGWAFCQGQIMSIAQNTALFSILGTTYGGNGQTTFALPDLRGRVPLGAGQGPGLPNYDLGELAGEPTHTLITSEIPAHLHSVKPNASASDGTDSVGENKFPAVVAINVNGTGFTANAYGATAETTLGSSDSSLTGGSQPHNNMQPYLGLNYIICLEGVYPPHN